MRCVVETIYRKEKYLKVLLNWMDNKENRTSVLKKRKIVSIFYIFRYML